jgi:hypothetical protein
MTQENKQALKIHVEKGATPMSEDSLSIEDL